MLAQCGCFGGEPTLATGQRCGITAGHADDTFELFCIRVLSPVAAIRADSETPVAGMPCGRVPFAAAGASPPKIPGELACCAVMVLVGRVK